MKGAVASAIGATIPRNNKKCTLRLIGQRPPGGTIAPGAERSAPHSGQRGAGSPCTTYWHLVQKGSATMRLRRFRRISSAMEAATIRSAKTTAGQLMTDIQEGELIALARVCARDRSAFRDTPAVER
jgi:hypothetical protein